MATTSEIAASTTIHLRNVFSVTCITSFPAMDRGPLKLEAMS